MGNRGACRCWHFIFAAAVCVVSSETVLAAAPAPSWTGFYAGLSFGQRWDRAGWTTNGFVIPGVPGVSPPYAFDTDASFGAAPTRFGGYFGYNFQIDRSWLLGLEADIGDAGNSSKSFVGIPGTGIGFALPLGANSSETTVDMTWDGSIRGRAGFFVAPNILLFGTGGVAFQHVKETILCSGALPAPSGCNNPLNFPNPTPDSISTIEKTLVGWTLGGGVEAALWNNWLLRAEYRYSDFGTLNETFALGQIPPVDSPGNAVVSTRITTQMMSVGLAYKFGATPAAEQSWSMPVTAPGATPNWTGFHAGLALGSRRMSADWTTTSLAGGLAPDADNEASFDSSAFRIGGYAGFDYQISRFVVGVEGGGGTAKNSESQPNVPGLGGMLFAGPDATTVEANWDANVVGRLGYLVAPDVLIYGVGGIAYQNVSVHAVCTAASFECLFDHDETVSETLHGPVFGGGLEAMVARSWLVRLDYRYADFGSVDHIFFSGEPFQSPTATTAIRMQSVTLGIAYHFATGG